MEFNASKFELLRYDDVQHLKEITSYTTAAGDEIKEETHVRDLGVTMNNKAIFNQHIQNVALASSKMTAMILRTFQTRTAAHMTFLWKTLVILRLEYCCQLWSPVRQGMLQELEGHKGHSPDILQRSVT